MKIFYQIQILILILVSINVYSAKCDVINGLENKKLCLSREFLFKEAFISAEIFGSLLGVSAQLIDNVDAEDRTKIQMAALVASCPEIGATIFEAVAATRLLRQSKYAIKAYIGKSAHYIKLT